MGSGSSFTLNHGSHQKDWQVDLPASRHERSSSPRPMFPASTDQVQARVECRLSCVASSQCRWDANHGAGLISIRAELEGPPCGRRCREWCALDETFCIVWSEVALCVLMILILVCIVGRQRMILWCMELGTCKCLRVSICFAIFPSRQISIAYVEWH